MFLGSIHSQFDSFFCYFGKFLKFTVSVSLTFPPHSWPCILYTCPPSWLSVKQYFTSLKPSQDVCFWRVLICILNIPNAGHFVNFWYTYMNDFYFHCHDKDLWSSLQIVSMVKNEPHFFPPFCIILQLFCAVFLLHSVKFYCCYYSYRWVDCLETKCRFLMETDSLESIEFLCSKRECIDNLVTIRSYSKCWSPVDIFRRNHGFQMYTFYPILTLSSLTLCFTFKVCKLY